MTDKYEEEILIMIFKRPGHFRRLGKGNSITIVEAEFIKSIGTTTEKLRRGEVDW